LKVAEKQCVVSVIETSESFSCLIDLHFAKLTTGTSRPSWRMEKSDPRIMGRRKGVTKQAYPAWLDCVALVHSHCHTVV
jgi:hypothetical protein